MVENGLAGRARAGLHGQGGRLDAVAAQVERGLLARGARRRSAFHRQDRHLLGEAQQRNCEGVGARLLGAVVPGDQHVVADAARHGRRHDQGRAAAVEQRRLQRRHAGILRRAPGPAERDQVEHPAVAADEGVVARLRVRPAVGKAAGLRAGARHAMLLHEGFEHAARLGGELGVVLIGARDRQAAHRLDRHIGRGRGMHREALDVAVEDARDQPGGFENRRHGVVILGRDQNGLHAGAIRSR